MHPSKYVKETLNNMKKFVGIPVTHIGPFYGVLRNDANSQHENETLTLN